MKKSWTISILFILIFGLATPVSGDEFVDKNPLTEEMQIASMIENSKSLSSDSLEIIKKDKNVLAVYGSIPDSKEGVESYEWWNSICGVVDSISAEEALEKYLYRSGGPIIGYGPNSTGYILVRIYSMYEKELTIEDFENIYSIIQEHSSKYNIDNPPVVFRSMDMPKAYSYTDRFRPVIGGLRITTGAGSGTVGFAAQRTNVSNSTGFVTAAHIVDFSSQELYQPAISLLRNNSVGFSTLY